LPIKGRVEINDIGDGWWEIRIGRPEWKEGYPLFVYHVVFEADEYENVSMNPEQYIPEVKEYEWRVTRHENGEMRGEWYEFYGAASYFPDDVFRVKNLDYLEISVDFPWYMFDVYLNGERIRWDVGLFRFYPKGRPAGKIEIPSETILLIGGLVACLLLGIPIMIGVIVPIGE